MTNQELRLILSDYLIQLPVDAQELRKATQNLIDVLDKQPNTKLVGMIERCLFCGQVVPSRARGGGDKNG